MRIFAGVKIRRGMKILSPSCVAGVQQKKEGTSYRLMTYVVQQEVEEGLLLYNTLTCCLALITKEEAQHMEDVEGLIAHRFLVPLNHNDKKYCKLLRVSAAMKRQRRDGIRKYTIVTTTGCNARCHYCFEKGTKAVNMTTETAGKVAQYIVDHRGGHGKVQIDWFGGEPLYNVKVMDRISTRLAEQGVDYFSRITTNGYLFSEKMVAKAVGLWHLRFAMITLDGTEQRYNRIKAYIHPGDASPFQRVLNNIGLLLNAGVKVSVRLHVSMDNLQDIEELMRILADRFGGSELLNLQILYLFELVGPEAKIMPDEERATLCREIRRLKDYGCQLGINKPAALKKAIKTHRCMVDSEDAVMIVPDGRLGLCEHHLEDRFFGHIDHDGWDEQVLRQSREHVEEIPECDSCAYYPRCYRLKICGLGDICFKEHRESIIQSIQDAMLREYRKI